MTVHLQDIAYFLVVTVFFKLVVATALSDMLRRIFKRLWRLLRDWLCRTEQDIIEWSHYRNHIAKRGHIEKRPVYCQDGDCTKVTR